MPQPIEEAANKQVGGEWMDVSQALENARVEAQARNYVDFLIVDVDAHHYETSYAPWQEIIQYIEDPVIQLRTQATMTKLGASSSMIHAPIGDRTVSGRIKRYGIVERQKNETELSDILVVKRAMDAMGINYSILFPTPLLNVGILPEVDVQVAINWAYARWITETILPREPRFRTMISLPFNDPDASLRMVETFGDRPGVVGFVVGSSLYRPVHHKMYMKVYAAIQERGLPLGFHSTYNWQDRMIEQFNKFLSAHGIGRTLYNMVHLTNWVINGIPERFPKLKVIWIESGLTWLPFVMQRLDAEYMMRSSEAPLLKRKPSEYIREFYYTQQPLEWTLDNAEMMRMTFDMIHAETQLLYASDYPHWDFDLPSSIYDLPFLTEHAKRRILGGNAVELFDLPELKKSEVV